MASQKRSRTASGQAKSGGTTTRPGSGNASSRNGGNRTASSTTVRSGKPGRAGAGQGGAAQPSAGQGTAEQRRAGPGRAGPGGSRGQAGRAQNNRGPGGGQGTRVQGGDRGSRSGGRPGPGGPNGGEPGQAPPKGALARLGLSAGPSARAANARYAPRWLQLTALVLSLAGLGVSIYLTIAHYTSPKILDCSAKGLIDCTKVTTSPESIVFGVFPVAVLGLAFYVFMVAINTPWAWRAPLPIIWWARLGGVVVGIGFVLYLVYAEVIEIGNICLWCTSVHVITFLLFALLIFAASIGGTTTDAKPAR
jgi:uncharacterized membrane protein